MISINSRRAASSLLILAALAFGLKTDVLDAKEAAQVKSWSQSLSFAETTDILPRMTHPVLHIDSTGISSIDVTITHIGEDDVLATRFGSSAPPMDAETVWHDKIDIAAPGEASVSPLNILQTVGALKTGLYFVTARDAGPHPSARLTVSKTFAVSNLGVQSFTGKTGITAQVRLLSTMAPAPGVEVALIAHDNREIARVRTDNQGFVHFDTPSDTAGARRPEALFAYGADGEYTPLFLSPYTTPKANPTAWLEVQNKDGTLKGFALVRGADGNAVSSANLYVTLNRKEDGGVAATQTLSDGGGGAYGFTLPMTKLPGHWQVSVYQKTDTSPDVLLAERTLDPTPAMPEGKRPQTQAMPSLVISPGRRSFQPGAPADIFVQPPFDADVNFIVATDTVNAALDQHIGKDGGAIQVPMPGNAAGAYVIGSAFAPADKDGAPLQYSMNATWLESDKGDKRLGIKLDAPESAAPGGTLTVGVSLTNFDNQPAFVSLAVLPADAPGLSDPLAYFLGPSPLMLTIDNSYGAEAAMDLKMLGDTLSPQMANSPMPLAWTIPAAVKADGTASLSVQLPGEPAKLRVYVVGWSATRLGLGASELTLTGKAAAKSSVPAARAGKAPWQSQIIAAGASQKLTLREAYVSVQPILAPPISVDKSGKADFIDPNDPAINALIETTLFPLPEPKLLQTAYLLQHLAGSGVTIPETVMNPLLNKVADVAAHSGIGKEQALFADLILFNAGRKDRQDVGAALESDAHIKSPMANAVLAALYSAMGDGDDAAKFAEPLSAASTSDGEKLFTLLLLNDAGQKIPSTATKALAAQYPLTQARDPLISLALALVAGAVTTDAPPYKIKLNDRDATVSGFLNLQHDPSGPPIVMINPNSAPLYLLQR